MLACAGCGGESLGGGHPTGSGGSVGTGSGGTGAATFCGEVDVPLYASPRPDVLLLVDRSKSMNDDSDEMTCTGGCGASSKWALVSAAINRLVTTHHSVNWGLALFGSDGACGVNAGVAVEFAQDAAPAIAQALAATTPGGEAPTAAAIDAATDGLLSRYDFSSPKYILLATDGRSGCATGGGGADAQAEEAVNRAYYYGFPTFVLGLAPDWDATAIAVLNQMAENGGEASPGTPNLFATPATIDAQLAAISPTPPTSTGNPCVVPLPYPISPATSLAVSVTTLYGHSEVVPEDPLTGWSFTSPDESIIYISGYACSGLQSSAYSYIAITYQCGSPPPARSEPPS